MMPFGAASLVVEAESLEVEFLPRQETEGHGFAVHARDGGDTDVDGLAVEFEVDATVLRHAALGDVEVRHDFQAGNQGSLKQAHVGRNGDFEQLAIDAVADAQIALQRLDVNVGRSFLQRLAEDLVDEIHDRGLLVGLVEDGGLLFEVVIVIARFAAFEEFFEILRTDAVALMQGFKNPMTRGDLPVDAFPQFLPDSLPCAEIEGIVGEDGDLAVRDICRTDAMSQGQFGREACMQALGGLSHAFIGIGHAESGGEVGEELVLVHHVRIDKGLDQRLAVVRSQFERVAEARGFLTSGTSGGADEYVDQGGGRHEGGYNAKPRAKFRGVLISER